MRFSDPYTRTCPIDSSKDWFPVRSLYIPASQSNTALAIANTTSDCLGSCKDTQCVSVIYNHGNRSCQMYSQTSTLGYRYVTVEGNRTEAFLGICDAGRNLKERLSLSPSLSLSFSLSLYLSLSLSLSLSDFITAITTRLKYILLDINFNFSTIKNNVIIACSLLLDKTRRKMQEI